MSRPPPSEIPRVSKSKTHSAPLFFPPIFLLLLIFLSRSQLVLTPSQGEPPQKTQPPNTTPSCFPPSAAQILLLPVSPRPTIPPCHVFTLAVHPFPLSLYAEREERGGHTPSPFSPTHTNKTLEDTPLPPSTLPPGPPKRAALQ